MSKDIFAPGFKEQPYWIDAIGGVGERGAPAALPASADVVIVGAGLTGVSAAHELARAGRHVVAVDAGVPGEGASSVNGGMLGRNTRHSFLLMSRDVSPQAAKTFFGELQQVYEENLARIEQEKLDCDFRRCGRFVGALSPQHFTKLAKEYGARAKHLGEDCEIVEGGAVGEMASDRYFGGVIVKDNASVQPAKYTRAMLRRAIAAGAQVIGQTPVETIVREKSGFTVHTRRGRIHARDVLVATNRPASRLTPYSAPRLAPIHAYAVTTEPLAPEVSASLLAHHRTYIDNMRAPRWLQLTPDRSRLVFGSRTGKIPPGMLRRHAAGIYQDILFLFPQLQGVRLTHAWAGQCAATADLFPHLSTHEGIHYAMGYCFSGLAMAPYLGVRAARRILGAPQAPSWFADREWPVLPWYGRNEWGPALLSRYYRFVDRPVRKT